MYVVSDQGKVVARYDERTLSATKLTYMYTPGTEPVTFEVDGYRFGLALGMDVHFPELYTAYERLDVDGVLVSYETGGDPGREDGGDRGPRVRRGEQLLDQPRRAGQPVRHARGRDRPARRLGGRVPAGRHAGHRRHRRTS